MFEAQRQWFSRLDDFAQCFRYQYVISRERESLDGFSHHAVGAWHIHCGQALAVTQLTDRSGRHLGFVLGIAVGPEGQLMAGTAALPFEQDDAQFWAQFERFLIETAGRFAFVLTDAKVTRLYTDPVGMIGAVYSEKDQLVAASPMLCMKRPLEPNPLFDHDIVRDEGGKYSLFHTADAHVRRLNPNYHLDLESFAKTRFWPKGEDFATPPANPKAQYEEIAARTSANIKAIAERFACSQPVSGGQDSRLLFAMGLQHAGLVDQFYTHVNNWATRRDAEIGQAICKAVNVPHEIHDKANKRPNRKEVRRLTKAFQIAMGAEARPPKEYINGTIEGVKDGNVILRGHQTDFLRAVFVFKPKAKWRDVNWQIERLLIVPRTMFNQDIAEKYSAEFKAWQGSLPENAMEKAADFMFLEVYYNSTVGAMFPALWRNFYVSPYNSRKLIELSLQFTEAQRRASEPVFDIVQMIDDRISKVPFDFEWNEAMAALDEAPKTDVAFVRRIKETQARLERYSGSSKVRKGLFGKRKAL